MARRRAVSLSYYKRDRKRRELKSRRHCDERAQRYACRCSISFRDKWAADRESAARDLSRPRNRGRSLGYLFSIGGKASNYSRGSPSARRRHRRDLTAAGKDRPMERLDSFSKSNPGDLSRGSGVVAKERPETAGRGFAINGRDRLEIVAESPRACPRWDRHH